ncbi:MAG TPA: LamG-like jellyroll fold domain-containing protein, partial [Gemmataceae bacterium]
GTGNPDSTLLSKTTVTTGQWVHVAAVRTRATGEIRIYVNGVEEGVRLTGNTNSLNAAANITIGGNTVDGRYFKGDMDEVRVWNIARSGDDIRADMFRTLSGSEAGLAGYWRLDDGEGAVATDSSPSGNHGAFGIGDPARFPTWVVSKAPVLGEPIATSTDATFQLIPPQDGELTVTVHVTDSLGNAGIASADTSVSNAAPTATFTNDGPVGEAGTATVSFTDVFDSAGDIDGLLFSYDFNNDGDFDDADDIRDSTLTSVAVPAHLTADGPAAVTIRGRVADAAGAFTDYTTALVVENVAPTVQLSGPTSGTAGEALAFTAAAADVSAADQAAGFHYRIEWGDGEVTELDAGDSVELSHAYAAGGTYVVRVYAVDKDGGESAPAEQTVEVIASGPQGPVVVVDGVLYITGTDGNDGIAVVNDPNGGLAVALNDQLFRGLTGVSQIQISAGAGNDVVIVAWGVAQTTIVDGGAGHDALAGGGGTNVLLGGQGDDILVGGPGGNVLVGGGGSDILFGGSAPDILIGGEGSDALFGLGGNDLLITGTTAYDDDPDALLDLLAQWTGGGVSLFSVSLRTTSKSHGGGGGQRLGKSTVFDDGAQDLAVGGSGRDKFFGKAHGRGADLIVGNKCKDHFFPLD